MHPPCGLSRARGMNLLDIPCSPQCSLHTYAIFHLIFLQAQHLPTTSYCTFWMKPTYNNSNLQFRRCLPFQRFFFSFYFIGLAPVEHETLLGDYCANPWNVNLILGMSPGLHVTTSKLLAKSFTNSSFSLDFKCAPILNLYPSNTKKKNGHVRWLNLSLWRLYVQHHNWWWIFYFYIVHVAFARCMLISSYIPNPSLLVEKYITQW